jgi:hypothetical protein
MTIRLFLYQLQFLNQAVIDRYFKLKTTGFCQNNRVDKTAGINNKKPGVCVTKIF